VSEDLKNWQPRPRPERKPIEGRTVRLEPLSAAKHGDGLYEASSVPDAGGRFAWLPDYPPETRAAFQPWLDKVEASEDPLFFTVIDKASGKVSYAVLSFGGFLGIGDDHYPLPWQSLKYDTSLGGYLTGVTETQLKGAPKYGNDNAWNWADPTRTRAVNDYYGVAI